MCQKKWSSRRLTKSCLRNLKEWAFRHHGQPVHFTILATLKMGVRLADIHLSQTLRKAGALCTGYDLLGNASLEVAVNWVVEHENDPDIDEMPSVPINSKFEAPKPSLTQEQLKAKQQELREKARKKKEEEEKRTEREREKVRIRVGKELLEAKRIEEDNERKRIIALGKAEKDEEKRARERIRPFCVGNG
nr:UBX domain-containing protein 1-like isoform X3 [Malus domestica]